jgi:hypothetical protein
MKATRFPVFLLLAGVALAAGSCSDSAPLGVAAGPGRSAGDLLGAPTLPTFPSLLSCTPQPYDSVTQTVGPDGGTIAVGAYSLLIPAGALDSAVSITAVATSDTVNMIRFQPEGLLFRPKAYLTMSYANCGVLGSLVPREIAHITDSLQVLDVLNSSDDPVSQSVTGKLKHFSDYAVAW